MSLKQPVQYPVKYYSHLDAGAPQLADADGIIKTILKACLVTGYDVKEGAGWTALFEDDFRIVLRRPLRTGNPPDIKIENGVINGTASHRIVSQDDPTGLDDTTELAAVNLIARDSNYRIQWHLLATDFAFIFCYQMDGTGRNQAKNNMLYCGSVMKIADADTDYFITNYEKYTTGSGTSSTSFPYGYYENNVKNMRDGVVIDNSNTTQGIKKISLGVGELDLNNDYLAQIMIINTKYVLPFLASLGNHSGNIINSVVSIDSRPMLRFMPTHYRTPASDAVLYIPLDYWEL